MKGWGKVFSSESKDNKKKEVRLECFAGVRWIIKEGGESWFKKKEILY